MPEASELLQNPEFLLKALSATTCLIGCYFWINGGEFKSCLQNMITYTALIGGFITSVIMMVGMFNDDRSRLLEDILQGVHCVLNLITSWLFIGRTSTACYPQPLSPTTIIFGSALAAGVGMAADIVMRTQNK